MAKKKSKPVGEDPPFRKKYLIQIKKGRVIFYDMITKKGYLVD